MEAITEVVCGIISYQGKILATRLAPHRKHAGQYEFPGGKVEDREELEEALARELKEELGISVQVHHHFHTVEVENGDNSLQLHAFFCTAVSNHLALTDHDEGLWMDVQDLPKLDWVKADRELVEMLTQGNI